MAPRRSTNKPRRQTHGAFEASSYTNARTRIAHTSQRFAGNGTVTQVEIIAPRTTPRRRLSPTSKGKTLLAAVNDLDLPEELTALQNTINDRHLDDTSDARFIPVVWATMPSLRLPKLDYDSTVEEITDFVQQIMGYYDFWSRDDTREGPATFFADLKVISHGWDDALRLPAHVIASPLVSAALRECRESKRSFVDIWRKAVLEAVASRLDQLRAQVHAQVNGGPTTIHEAEFSAFVWEILNPASGHEALWGPDKTPITPYLSEAATVKLVDCVDKLLFAFQDATYQDEAKELWLLIWRSLRTAFTAFTRGGAPTSPTDTLRDRRFFGTRITSRDFEHLMHGSEAIYPRKIEDIVGRYCQYISHCQIDQDNKYESLHRTPDTALRAHTKDALKEFCKTGKFETSTLAKLHFVVARFNKIKGRPVIVRRWNPLHDNGVWRVLSLESDSATSLPSNSAREHGKVQQSFPPSPPLTPRSPTLTVGGPGADKSPKRVFPFPEGINLKSDFDYVWCPFPETRAHEVAQSEQISRELAQPGISSEGPRPEYLINRPPRHARDPAEITQFNYRPFSWIRGAFQRLLAPQRHLPAVRKSTFAGLPSRRDRRSPLESGSTILDQKARVHKPTMLRNVPGLRGGAGRPTHYLTGPSRGHHFDSTAFHRMMVEKSIRALKSKYGLQVAVDQDEIMKLLPQTGYDIEELCLRYTAPGRGKTAGPSNAGHVYGSGITFDRATATGSETNLRQFYSLPVAEDDEVREYRVNNSPRATGDGYAEQDSNSDDEPDFDQENHPPGPNDRVPLGELTRHPTDDEIIDHIGHGPSPPTFSPSSDGPPGPLLMARCHPCPVYPRHIHHGCPGWQHCGGYGDEHDSFFETTRPGPRIFVDEDVDDEQRNRPGWNQDGTPNGTRDRTPVRTPGNSSNHSRHSGNNDEQGSGRRNHGGGHDDERQDDQLPQEKPKHEDEWTVEETFSLEVPDFRTNLITMGERLYHGQKLLDQPDKNDFPAGMIWPLRMGVVKPLKTMRADYMSRLKHTSNHVKGISFDGQRSKAARESAPATLKLCQILYNDVRFRHSQLMGFFDYTHPRPQLGFRHAFNALIIALKEFLLVVQEINFEFPQVEDDENDGEEARKEERDEQGDDEDVNESEESDGEDESAVDDNNNHNNSSSDFSVMTPPLNPKTPPKQPAPKQTTPKQPTPKQPTPKQPTPKQPTPKQRSAESDKTPSPKLKKVTKDAKSATLPRRADYEAMFIPELLRELTTNRGVKDAKAIIDKKSLRKDDYIDLLLGLDGEGNLGKGATECYRNITGNTNARGVPKGWDLEVELKNHYKRNLPE